MKTFLSIFIFSLLFIGCNKDSNTIIPPVDDRKSFEINFLQYSDNNYFIDEVYTDTSAELNTFNLYYGSQIPTVLTKYIVKDIQVFISINQISQQFNSIIGCAYSNLPPRSSSIMYSDSLRNISEVILGQNEAARFRLLNSGSEYLFHPETGYITLLFSLTDETTVAVAYRVENSVWEDSDDLFYGEFISELVNNSKSVGVLKLVKPRNLIPEYETTWKLKMKNIYQITPNVGQITNLDLDIYLKKSDGTELNSINNVRLLELFGFDRFNEDGTPGSDGRFDNRAGINFNPLTAEIIFPVLQPFGNNIPHALNDYKYQAFYDTVKFYLSIPGNSFNIKGKYKPI